MSKPAEGETPRTDALQAMQPVGTVWLEHARTLESELQAAEERLRAAERRYEYVRRLNVPQFAELFRRCIETGAHFDDEVDAALQRDSGKE